MANTSTIVKGLVAGVLTELMVRSDINNVLMDDGTTLAAKLSEIVTSINDINTEIDSLPTSDNVDSKISAAIDALIDGAPETYDTLKEIADYLATHQNEYTALLTTIAGKVDKIEGKGLSTEDFTTALKNKLDGIAEGANKYELPAATTSTIGGVKPGANLSVTADGTLNAVDTTYENATTTTAGLMSAADKAALDSKPNIYIQAEQPANLKAGDLWFQIV